MFANPHSMGGQFTKSIFSVNGMKCPNLQGKIYLTGPTACVGGVGVSLPKNVFARKLM